MKNSLKKLSATLLLATTLFFNIAQIAIADAPTSEETGEAAAQSNPSTPAPIAPAATPPPSTTAPSPKEKAEEAKTSDPESIELQKAFDTINKKENDCLPEDLLPGYFYTIMEEPLILKEPLTYEEHKALVDQGARYISKICFRNTLQYSIDYLGERFTYSLEPYLGIKCSEKAQKLQKTYAYTKDPTVLYYCDPVQVLISKGGTSLLEGYIKTLYSYAASIAGIIAVSIIVVSGIQISASGGDSGKIDEGKKRIIKSVIGIVVLFLSSLILYTINPNFFVKTTSQSTISEETKQP
ncbi:MAG: pilin [Candidatus Gracilibacteria bacterium]|jgi:hypothetical protein|nr:pilin [Candidatus Gracilibacteria bacterium]